jgi:hypothetical protein
VPPSPSPPRSPSPPPPDNDDDDDDLYTLPRKTPSRQASPPAVDMSAVVRLIGEGIAAAQPTIRTSQGQPDGRIGTARLKMKNPESYDGAATTRFSRWWESVVMFLGFYPNTTDRQKIAWVGALLTDTALS